MYQFDIVHALQIDRKFASIKTFFMHIYIFF